MTGWKKCELTAASSCSLARLNHLDKSQKQSLFVETGFFGTELLSNWFRRAIYSYRNKKVSAFLLKFTAKHIENYFEVCGKAIIRFV
jgi:hypothetical protein